MKKMLILAGVIALSMTTQTFALETATPPGPLPQKQVRNCPVQPGMHRPPFDKDKFDARLKLTDEQKEQAKQIRENGHQALKPIMDKIAVKRAEIKTIRLSKLAPQAQEEKILPIRKELRELKQQAHEIRMKNMKEFEAILTKKQLKELNKMKEEGRKAFEKSHKNGGLKVPPNWQKPDFGPTPPPKPPVE